MMISAARSDTGRIVAATFGSRSGDGRRVDRVAASISDQASADSRRYRDEETSTATHITSHACHANNSPTIHVNH